MLVFNRAKFALVLTALSAAIAAQPARALSVYPSCDSPPSQAGHAWYVDPVKGSRKGDGTKQKPWHTLAEVVYDNLIATAPDRWEPRLHNFIKAKPNAPIKPGDTIYLLSGNHGSIRIQGFFGNGATLNGYANKQFITIAALPNQTPVIQNLMIIGASHFIFRGITFMSTNNTGAYAAVGSNGDDYTLVQLNGPHDNMVFDSNHFLSQPDVSGWSIRDWVTKRATGFSELGGSCVSLTDNSFKNVGFGIRTQRSQKVLIDGNTIDYFADDGIDYGSDDLTMQNNTITNSIEDGDGFHRDGMQGQPANETITVSNVVIRNNKVIRIADVKIPYPGSLQGIDAFDGLWNNVTVDHNTVITNTGEGLTFMGASNIKISNNSVLGDSGRVLPCYNLGLTQCEALAVEAGEPGAPVLRIRNSKTRVPSSNVSITDNVISGMTVDPSTTGLTVSGNLCLTAADSGKCIIGMPVDGVMRWVGAPGVIGDNNLISSQTPAQVFGTFDISTARYSTTIQSDPRK